MTKICQYCGSEKEADEKRCTGCDAASFGEQAARRFYEGKPFHYNGYVVWWIEDIMHQTVEYLFYLGDRLVECITFSRCVLEQFIPESCDAMPFIWDLFKLAQGEEEVVRITEQNTIKPVVFEITVKRSPEQEWAVGLMRNGIYQALVDGERELTYRA